MPGAARVAGFLTGGVGLAPAVAAVVASILVAFISLPALVKGGDAVYEESLAGIKELNTKWGLPELPTPKCPGGDEKQKVEPTPALIPRPAGAGHR